MKSAKKNKSLRKSRKKYKNAKSKTTRKYLKGGVKTEKTLKMLGDKFNKLSNEYQDCIDKYCSDIMKKIDDNRKDSDEYRQKMENKCNPDKSDFQDDLDCETSKCKKQLQCNHEFYMKSKYGKLNEKYKKCGIKNCSIKGREMNEAEDTLFKYRNDKEKEKEKEKGFFNFLKFSK